MANHVQNSNQARLDKITAYPTPAVIENTDIKLSAGFSLLDKNDNVVIDEDGNLSLSGILGNRITVTSATHPVACTDGVILLDATSNSITVNLQAAATAGDNKRLKVKRIDNVYGNTVTIQADGAETIDGINSRTIDKQWAAFEYVCDGSAWFIF